jgi:hypothetical protein
MARSLWPLIIKYPVVLVRLPRITRARLREVLELGTRFVTRGARKKAPTHVPSGGKHV